MQRGMQRGIAVHMASSYGIGGRVVPSFGTERHAMARQRLCSRQHVLSPSRTDIDTDAIDNYNKMMCEQMGWGSCDLNPYEYHPERGLYFHLVWQGVFCGSQPQTVDDIIALHEEGITSILSLQQPKDLEYWGVDGDALFAKAAELGMEYVRVGAVDFDQHSLRNVLPNAVRELERLRQGKCDNPNVYVHCTAGLGRAPAVIIAWLYWFTTMDLDEAYNHLTSIRPCGPKAEAIRGATFDILDGRHRHEFDHLPHNAWRSLSSSDRANIAQRLFNFASN